MREWQGKGNAWPAGTEQRVMLTSVRRLRPVKSEVVALVDIAGLRSAAGLRPGATENAATLDSIARPMTAEP